MSDCLEQALYAIAGLNGVIIRLSFLVWPQLFGVGRSLFDTHFPFRIKLRRDAKV